MLQRHLGPQTSRHLETWNNHLLPHQGYIALHTEEAQAAGSSCTCLWHSPLLGSVANDGEEAAVCGPGLGVSGRAVIGASCACGSTVGKIKRRIEAV